MKTNILKIASLSILGFLTEISLVAQPQASFYADLGQSVVYEGLFVKNVGLLNYQFGKYKPEIGLQYEIRNFDKYFLSGYAFRISREFLSRNFALDLQSFYVVTPSSSLLRETNWGFISNIARKHFSMSVGVDFRTFAYTKNGIRDYNIRSNAKIHELWNIVYSFSYYIKPINHPWNTAISVANLDNFTIEHETNPIMSLQALFRLSSGLKVFVETRCKANAPFNLNVNSFGYSLRTGIIIKM